MNGKSSIGLKPNVAAVFSYFLIWISGIFSSVAIVAIYALFFFWYNGSRGRSGGYDSPSNTQVAVVFAFGQIISAGITIGAGCALYYFEKKSRFVRLHTVQAILFATSNFAASFVLAIIAASLGGESTLSTIVNLTFLVGWILLGVNAYKSNLKLPIISEIAEKIVSK
jgi:uncharacterized membrane protein